MERSKDICPICSSSNFKDWITDIDGMNIDECTSACSAQQNTYEDWDDPEKENAFKDLKSCIVAEECDLLNEGVCYDEDVYIW